MKKLHCLILSPVFIKVSFQLLYSGRCTACLRHDRLGSDNVLGLCMRVVSFAGSDCRTHIMMCLYVRNIVVVLPCIYRLAPVMSERGYDLRLFDFLRSFFIRKQVSFLVCPVRLVSVRHTGRSKLVCFGQRAHGGFRDDGFVLRRYNILRRNSACFILIAERLILMENKVSVIGAGGDGIVRVRP